MSLGINIGLGIMAGIIIIHLAVWIGIVAVYGLITFAESLAKMWRQRNLK